MANLIVKFISKTLLVGPGPKNKKVMMEKTLSHVKVCDHMHDYILLSKVAIAQQEVLTGVMRALDENRHSNRVLNL
jgi:hypothetical protein